MRKLLWLFVILLLVILYLLIRAGASIQGQQQVPGQLDIPDLRGLTYQEAQQVVTRQGLHLLSQNGTVGLVSDQSPIPPTKVHTGDTIVVRMDPNKTKAHPASGTSPPILDRAVVLIL